MLQSFFYKLFFFIFCVSGSSYGNKDAVERLSTIYDAYMNNKPKDNSVTTKIALAIRHRNNEMMKEESVEDSVISLQTDIADSLPMTLKMKNLFKDTYGDIFRGYGGKELNTDFSCLFLITEIFHTSVDFSYFSTVNKDKLKSYIKVVALDVAKNVKGSKEKVTLIDLVSSIGIDAFEKQFLAKLKDSYALDVD